MLRIRGLEMWGDVGRCGSVLRIYGLCAGLERRRDADLVRPSVLELHVHISSQLAVNYLVRPSVLEVAVN